MPSSRPTLDLEAWSNYLVQERSNDYEYNVLLYKFKTFFNEVRVFHELHSNCSVTRACKFANDGESASFSLPQINKKNGSNHSNIIGSQIVNDKKRLFQNDVEVSKVRDLISKQFSFNNSLSPVPSHSYDLKKVQHYNSSYNLPSIVNNNSLSNVGMVKPEIKQRNQTPISRLLLSRSSERLESINNNSANDREKQNQNDVKLANFNAPVARDSRYMLNDTNIYDAVSPDDTATNAAVSNCNNPNVAASIQNLNRISMMQRSKLESSKSTLCFGYNGKQAISNSSPKAAVASSKSSPNSNHNIERSDNSFGSSLINESTNHSSSSLSLMTSLPGKDHNKDSGSHYSNYVNIDFFLKRGTSPPSLDGLNEVASNKANSSDDNEDTDDVDTTQMSQSISSDQLCGGSPQPNSSIGMLQHVRVKRRSTSSLSVTPASSSDPLEEQQVQSSLPTFPPNKQVENQTTKLSSFFSSGNRGDESSSVSKSSTSPKDSSSRNQHMETLNENMHSFSSVRQTAELNSSLAEAHITMRSFLSDLNLSPPSDVFEDKAQRRIVKESFAVEYCGRRKLRHLFLFNDVIVCAKYQASSKQKFTFDVKWYLNLNEVAVLDLSSANNQVKYDKETIENQILGIRTSLMLLRSQMQHIKRSKNKQPAKVLKKLKKKRTELEAELVLLLPHLPLVIKHVNGKKYTFFLSSNFDKSQWIESIKFLQSQLPVSKLSSALPTSSELQAWIQTCRKNLNPSLGTFLLRSNCDDDLLYGDLYISLSAIEGITKNGSYYFCFEVDSYGHFSQKASSAITQIQTSNHLLNEEYVFPLDGAHTLRILIYEDLGANSKPSVVGKAHIELSRAWFLDKPVEKVITFNSNCLLTTKLSYSSSELLSSRIPHAKLCPTFGMDITQVCKKEKTNVPLLIQLCVNEVERRGMREVGIYRMSGTSTDIQKLKKAFETNPYVAEILLRDIDINSVTGFLKTYLREMPEGLFSNKLYLKFVAAFNVPPSESLERTKMMLELFHKIPITNQHTIIYLVEHLVKVNKFESYNKMSLTNLATVLGPNILRSPTDSSGSSSSDPFTAVVIGSMSQAGILYFFLNRKFSNLPLTELSPSELA